ncbi:MAG: heme biosynthesis HemY N-terminal domain-containing protein [Gammaproteobacteria bacterium]|nr:heme biosynthesis HemY N-terminal domain-containing protein [Gammaproteobacteria bacterium]
MIRLFVFSLLVIILALWVTLYVGFPNNDPGYILISFDNYTFETSLFALFIALVVIYLLYRLLVVFVQWINPGHLIRYGKEFNSKRKAAGRSNSIEGLLYFARGNWQSSYNLLTKSAGDKDASVINLLAAAYSAYQLGNKDSWLQCLDKAEVEYPSARSTINTLRAQLLFESGQLEQCVAVLEQLRKNSLNDMALLRMLKEVYMRLEDWNQLGQLLPVLKKNKIVDMQELARMQMRIFMEELYASVGELGTDNDKQSVVNQLAKHWKKAPAKYREDEKVVKHYAELLIRLDERVTAAKVIEMAISRNWSDALVRLYGEQDFDASEQQLLVAEKWLKERPANATLLLSLGRICLRNQLWGKAREYYEVSIGIAPSAEALGELSRLLKHLGEVEASGNYLESYGNLIGTELPELPMPSESNLTH